MRRGLDQIDQGRASEPGLGRSEMTVRIAPPDRSRSTYREAKIVDRGTEPASMWAWVMA